ncbi:nickel-dependent hydrogenase large subunit [Clostridium omnivorum]|uniref:NADH dehydrogenase n=1 Tax=Clostridium omnivorum TaxID=1604902 RepID=A0ABQ5N788_9CLOT|nr:nickel-dependent hydrogenase large subunit [Clostridium sp. E14]GLC31061.1 NADH dehydrogenase [Clostridium sp. E14]
MAKTVIPFGPQHPVFPEPLQLKLVMDDDKVIEALPALGYVHRGLEKIAELKDFNQSVYIVERVCGICSFMHSMAYVRGIEDIMNIQIPERAEYLRVIWAEIGRLQSHFLWLGLLADAFGFESLFMETWRYREKILDLMEMTTGNRVIISANKVGGVTKDMTEEHIKIISSTIDELDKEMHDVEKVFFDNYTVKKRLVGVGTLTYQEAKDISVVGPMARASGIHMDLRTTGYSAYKYLNFEPVVEKDGDSYARCIVRIRDIYQSFDLIRQCIAKIPSGEIAVPVKGNPNGEAISRIEQPRGEAIYYIKGNGTKNLQRLKIRTPTFQNIPALLKMLPGSNLQDVPILALTIDPCISCTER